MCIVLLLQMHLLQLCGGLAFVGHAVCSSVLLSLNVLIFSFACMKMSLSRQNEFDQKFYIAFAKPL